MADVNNLGLRVEAWARAHGKRYIGLVEDRGDGPRLTANWPDDLPRPTDEDLAAISLHAEFRGPAYPDIGNQLDAIWKALNQMRRDGIELPQATDDMLDRVLQVKKDYPKA